MAAPRTRENFLDRVLLLFLLALLLFASPLVDRWATAGSPWYLPYLLWLLLIIAMWRLQRRAPRESDDV